MPQQDALWKRAATWGIAGALLHRLVLQLWGGAIWLVMGEWLLNLPQIRADYGKVQDPFTTVFERSTLGIWLRWDAVAYLKIADGGYTSGTSVFYPLYPLFIRFLGALPLISSVLAGLLISTAALALALTLLYRLVVHYFQDEASARWTLIAFLLFPVSYFMSSIHTESLFLALVLASLWLQLHQQWWWAGVLGGLATLTRSQGVVLLAPLGWIILEQAWQTHPQWAARLKFIILRALPLLWIPAGVVGFLLWRRAAGFESMSYVFANYGVFAKLYSFPLQGYWIEMQSLFKQPGFAYVADFSGLFFAFVVLCAMLLLPRYRIPTLLWYGWGIWLTLGTKVNFYEGSVPTIQSGLRYTLMIFPLFIVLGDQLANGGKRLRLGVVAIGATLSLILSAMNALYIGLP